MAKVKNSASEMGHNGPTSLRSYVDRLVRLEEEKRALAEDIKEVKLEAKSQGFDSKVITQMVRESLMDESARAEQREFETLCEVYRASLGMLNGTPLGDAAIDRLSGKPVVYSPPPAADAAPEKPLEAIIPAEPEEPPLTIDDARGMGADAARNNKPVTSNPFPARDPRRAAWDEAWCSHAGSDGMEIPDAWRRKPKKKPESQDLDVKK